jgi:hypothetical protein
MARYTQRSSKINYPTSVSIGIVTANSVMYVGNAYGELEMFREDTQYHRESYAIRTT